MTQVLAPEKAKTVSDMPMPEVSASRVNVADLLERVRRTHIEYPQERHVFLILQLNRSDRLHALAQSELSRLVHSEVSRRFKRVLRASDSYSFVSIDEVWVLLCNLPSESLGKMAAKTLKDHLSRPLQVESSGQEVLQVQLRPLVGGVWASVGNFVDSLALVSAAAECLTQARGNDEHVVVTEAKPDNALKQRNALEKDLRTALHGNELEVFYQPQIHLQKMEAVSIEALIRWRRKGEFVNPALIASICEERGMMNQLTQFVLNSSLRHLMQWQMKGLNYRVSINLSAVTMADDGFPSLIEQALSTWGIGGDKLTLELTESTIVQNEAAAIDFMKRLKALGCRLAIDDFGTGYSSFAYLRQFPLDELKIDQSFVRNCAHDEADFRIVRTLVDLAHGFGLEALAEGVEDERTLSTLSRVGCDLVQGYYFSKALPPGELERWRM